MPPTLVAILLLPQILLAAPPTKPLFGCARRFSAFTQGPERAGDFSPFFYRTADQIHSSKKIRYFDNDGELYNGFELVPGESYTVLIRNGKLILGKGITGISQNTVGSHRTIMQLLGKKFAEQRDYKGMAGALRINANGSVDISGYHLQSASDEAAKNIEDLLKIIVPGVETRTTPDRLNTLR